MQPTLVSQQIMEGRKVLRFDHECLREWGYQTSRTEYFYVVEPQKLLPKAPLLVILHSAGGDAQAELPKYLEKPWFKSLACFYTLALNSGQGEDDWWGAHAIRDHKSTYAKRLTPVESRVLATLQWVLANYPIDPDRVYLYGGSMGGSGGLGIAMPRGDLFAAIYIEIPAGFDHFYHRMGLPNPADSKISFLPISRFPDPPVLVFAASHMDRWGEGLSGFLNMLGEQRLAAVFTWGPWGHSADPWKQPTLSRAAWEFPWQSVRRNEAYPAFTNSSTDGRWPGYMSSGPDQYGQINGYFRWCSVTDLPDSFAMELRLVQEGELDGPDSRLPAESTTDVTIRRFQRFVVEWGKIYAWRFEREGKLVGCGTARADVDGLLTIPRLEICRRPSRLTLTR
ncbi:MAG: hypothetical protein ACE15E_03680 [Acidobacteriota bacterium]